MVQTPLNKFIVQFDKAYMDEVETKSGIKLYRDTTFHPENHAQTNGMITNVPKYLEDDMDITEGDQIYFSYQVVEDKEQRDRDSDVHKNLLFYNQQKSWIVDKDLIYFRVRGDEIKMVNGYALLNLIEEEVKSTLIIPDYLKKTKLVGQARIICSETLSRGETVFFDKRFIETYELFGSEYYILNEDRILARL